MKLRFEWPPTINTYYFTDKRGRRLMTKAAKQWHQIHLPLKEPKAVFTERVAVLFELYLPDNRRRDVDNVLKPLCDLLEGLNIVADDSQIHDLRVVRRGVEPPGEVLCKVSSFNGAKV